MYIIYHSISYLISSTHPLTETSNPIGSVSSKNRGSDSLLNGASQLIQFFQASSSRSVGKLWLTWILDCRTYENKNQLRSQDMFETKHSYWNKKHVFKWFTPKINRICSKSPHIQYFLLLAQAICYHTMVIPPKKKCIHLLKQNKHHRSNPQLYPPKPTPCPFPENAWVFHLANDYQNWSLFDLRKCCLGWRNVTHKDIYRRIMTDIQFLSLETSIQSIYILTASPAWPLAFHIHPCWVPSSRFQRQDLKQYLSIYRMEKMQRIEINQFCPNILQIQAVHRFV